MDIRLAMVEMQVAQELMDYQRDGWKQNPDEALPRWPLFDQRTLEAPAPQAADRASGWRALPVVAALSRLWSSPRQL